MAAAPEPTSAELLAAGLAGFAKTRSTSPRRRSSPATNPAAAVDALRDAAEGLGEVVWAGLNPAPETPLNVDIGPHRRYAIVRNRLDDFRYVKGVLGGTVNDVVLTVVSGALARWLRSRGVRTEGLELRALVPVSIRPPDAAPPARQPDRADARAAARLHPRPGRAAALREAVDGRAEGVEAGGRRESDRRPSADGAADDPRAGVADGTSRRASST